jgi:hypothetical protein
LFKALSFGVLILDPNALPLLAVFEPSMPRGILLLLKWVFHLLNLYSIFIPYGWVLTLPITLQLRWALIWCEFHWIIQMVARFNHHCIPLGFQGVFGKWFLSWFFYLFWHCYGLIIQLQVNVDCMSLFRCHFFRLCSVADRRFQLFRRWQLWWLQSVLIFWKRFFVIERCLESSGSIGDVAKARNFWRLQSVYLGLFLFIHWGWVSERALVSVIS